MPSYPVGEIAINLTSEGHIDGRSVVFTSAAPSMNLRVDLPGSDPVGSAVVLLRRAADQLEAGIKNASIDVEVEVN